MKNTFKFNGSREKSKFWRSQQDNIVSAYKYITETLIPVLTEMGHVTKDLNDLVIEGYSFEDTKYYQIKNYQYIVYNHMGVKSLVRKYGQHYTFYTIVEKERDDLVIFTVYNPEYIEDLDITDIKKTIENIFTRITVNVMVEDSPYFLDNSAAVKLVGKTEIKEILEVNFGFSFNVNNDPSSNYFYALEEIHTLSLYVNGILLSRLIEKNKDLKFKIPTYSNSDDFYVGFKVYKKASYGESNEDRYRVIMKKRDRSYDDVNKKWVYGKTETIKKTLWDIRDEEYQKIHTLLTFLNK